MTGITARIVRPHDVPEWHDDWGDAKTKLVHSSLISDQVIEAIRGNNLSLAGDCLPWFKTHGDVRFRPGEVTLWMGYNGHRKSMLIGQVATGFSAQKGSTVISSFEMRPYQSLKRMVLQAAGGPDPSDGFVKRYCDWVRVWFYDHFGPARKEQVYGLIRYADTIGARHIVIDSMMKVIAAEDDYNGQKDFVNTLCALAQAQEVHIHLVHHSRKGADESAPPGKQDAKGSGAITDQVDNVMVVWTNKRKERDYLQGKTTDEAEPDALLIVDKQRNGEFEGRIALWMDRDSCQFMGAPGKKLDLMEWPYRLNSPAPRMREPGEDSPEEVA